MRKSHLIFSLFLTVLVYANTAMAVETATPAAAKEAKLESISGIATADKIADDKCPMHKGNKDYKEHHGEPCPYHGKDHPQKCDHKQRKD